MIPQQLLARLRAQFGSLTTTQLATLVVAFLAVAGLVSGSAWFMSRPTYALLFADMDPESAAEVIAKLDAQKVKYQLDAGGRNVRVPADDVDKLRLELTAQGLPTTGRVGFEIFDRTAFGATEFQEHVNYRRALEGEIARTIATLQEVASARVHIALAKESLFGSRDQPAKASVVLKLRSARPLAPATIQGITNLVAQSVEGLRADAVVVMDSFGHALARPPAPDDDTPLGSAETERQQRVEQHLASTIVSLVEPIVGPNRVRANVAVRLSSASEERTEEKWDPTAPVIRSKQETSDITPAAGALGGVAGARGNLPPPTPASPAGTPAPTPTPAAPANVASRTSNTTNWEISRTTVHTIRPRGDIARMSVAVVVDDDVVTGTDKEGKPTQKPKPRSAAELQKLQSIVASAVGIDSTRGDQLTVENIAFEQPAVEEIPAPSFIERYGDGIGSAGRMLTVLAVAGLLIFFVLRPLIGQIGSAPAAARALPAGSGAAVAAVPLPPGQLPAAAAAPLRTVAEMEGEIEAQLDAAAQQKSLDTLRMPVLARKASAIVKAEPESAARLVRGWLNEEER
jgi:flagellar M-ring protein FliF